MLAAWSQTFAYHALDVLASTGLVCLIFWLLRQPLRELYVPLLDELRDVSREALLGKRQPVILRAAALVAAALLCSLTLLAGAILIGHVATPVG